MLTRKHVSWRLISHLIMESITRMRYLGRVDGVGGLGLRSGGDLGDEEGGRLVDDLSGVADDLGGGALDEGGLGGGRVVEEPHGGGRARVDVHGGGGWRVGRVDGEGGGGGGRRLEDLHAGGRLESQGLVEHRGSDGRGGGLHQGAAAAHARGSGSAADGRGTCNGISGSLAFWNLECSIRYNLTSLL